MPSRSQSGPILLLLLAGVITTPLGYAVTSFLHISGWTRLPLSFLLGVMAVVSFALVVREGILGTLNEPKRAWPELRRRAEKLPGTREANGV